MTDNLHELDEAMIRSKLTYALVKRDNAPDEREAALWHQSLLELDDELRRRGAERSEGYRLLGEAFSHGSWSGILDEDDYEWSTLTDDSNFEQSGE